jgi:predicted secreted hydrolase
MENGRGGSWATPDALTKAIRLPKVSLMIKKPQRSSPHEIHLPGDEGAHPDFTAEWWYCHLNLVDSQGGEYGVMAAYFNFGLRILAISDLKKQRFYYTAAGSALHPAERFFELRWGGRDHWYRQDTDSFSYHIESYSPEISLNLDLYSGKPPLLGCGNGIITWTGGTSYYYQYTRLRVKGWIELSGRTMDVEGLGVMDHQWMNYLGEGGWNWFCLQLDNDTEIVFWQIVNTDGTLKSRDLTIMFPDSSLHHSKDFVLERLDSWVSPETGRDYGILWRVREGAHDLDLEIRASYPQQEIRMFEKTSLSIFPFWEGNMVVSGRLEGRTVSGIGYTEIVRSSDSSGGAQHNG